MLDPTAQNESSQPIADEPAPLTSGDTLDDRALMSAVAMRDADALMTLYARHGHLVHGMALRVLGDPASAEEVTQDIFLKVWNQPARWDPGLGKLSSWLLTTTRNAAIDRLRQEHRQWRSLDEEPAWESLQGEDALADAPLWADGHLLREILTSLPYQQRQLVELAFYGGHTHSELAKMLDLPLGTVKTRLRAAIQLLRETWIQANTASAATQDKSPHLEQGTRNVLG